MKDNKKNKGEEIGSGFTTNGQEDNDVSAKSSCEPTSKPNGWKDFEPLKHTFCCKQECYILPELHRGHSHECIYHLGGLVGNCKEYGLDSKQKRICICGGKPNAFKGAMEAIEEMGEK